MLVASSADAAPATLVGEVAYNFVDQNGTGWVTIAGKVTVTLTFAGKDGSLKITGQRESRAGTLVAGKSGKRPDMAVQKSDRPVTESYALHDVAITGATIAFQLDPIH